MQANLGLGKVHCTDSVQVEGLPDAHNQSGGAAECVSCGYLGFAYTASLYI